MHRPGRQYAWEYKFNAANPDTVYLSTMITDITAADSNLTTIWDPNWSWCDQ